MEARAKCGVLPWKYRLGFGGAAGTVDDDIHTGGSYVHGCSIVGERGRIPVGAAGSHHNADSGVLGVAGSSLPAATTTEIP